LHPEVWPKLEHLVDPVTRGDPESPLRWTCKSTHTLSAEMLALHGISLCDKTVAKLLREHGYSLQAPNKSVEGTQHPDRNAQFEHIHAKAQDCVDRGVPVNDNYHEPDRPLCRRTSQAADNYRDPDHPTRNRRSQVLPSGPDDGHRGGLIGGHQPR
jgi:hypothetical protein